MAYALLEGVQLHCSPDAPCSIVYPDQFTVGGISAVLWVEMWHLLARKLIIWVQPLLNLNLLFNLNSTHWHPWDLKQTKKQCSVTMEHFFFLSLNNLLKHWSHFTIVAIRLFIFKVNYISHKLFLWWKVASILPHPSSICFLLMNRECRHFKESGLYTAALPLNRKRAPPSFHLHPGGSSPSSLLLTPCSLRLEAQRQILNWCYVQGSLAPLQCSNDFLELLAAFNKAFAKKGNGNTQSKTWDFSGLCNVRKCSAEQKCTSKKTYDLLMG